MSQTMAREDMPFKAALMESRHWAMKIAALYAIALMGLRYIAASRYGLAVFTVPFCVVLSSAVLTSLGIWPALASAYRNPARGYALSIGLSGILLVGLVLGCIAVMTAAFDGAYADTLLKFVAPELRK